MDENIYKLMHTLVQLFIKRGHIDIVDQQYYLNLICGALQIPYKSATPYRAKHAPELYRKIGSYAARKLRINKYNFTSRLGDLLNLSPAQLRAKFAADQAAHGGEYAFDQLHQNAFDSYFIKADLINKNVRWTVPSIYGTVDMTINNSKPEKSIHDISRVLQVHQVKYPKCALCKENIGFASKGRNIYNQNLRYIYEELHGHQVFMHFSPYEYYDHHLVINDIEHRPMEISEQTFWQMSDFVTKYPFYFIGSNADLPIVGGSILNHAHYQGGKKDLPLFGAKTKQLILHSQDVQVDLLDWPLSTIKITSASQTQLVAFATALTNYWYQYQNEAINIFNNAPKRHNAITPLIELRNHQYVLYLIFRNNFTNVEFPGGMYHSRPEHWNIKQENIGLIEAAGKAILPGRLIDEMAMLKDNIKNQVLPKPIAHHQLWFEALKVQLTKTKSITNAIYEKMGQTFVTILEDCRVFKNDADLIKMIREFHHGMNNN